MDWGLCCVRCDCCSLPWWVEKGTHCYFVAFNSKLPSAEQRVTEDDDAKSGINGAFVRMEVQKLEPSELS